MKDYNNAYFDCTIAVSRSGYSMLISATPQEIEGLVVRGDFPGHAGWKRMPTTPGFYRCRIRVSSFPDDPKLTCEECYPTNSVIQKAEIFLDSNGQ